MYTLGPQPKSTIERNLLIRHDAIPNELGTGGVPPNAFYHDNGSGGWTDKWNVIMGTWNDFCAFNPTGGLYGLDKRGFSPRVCPGKDGQQADCSIHYEHNWLQGSFASRAGGAKFWGVNVSNNSFVPAGAALPPAAQAVVAAAGPRYAAAPTLKRWPPPQTHVSAAPAPSKPTIFADVGQNGAAYRLLVDGEEWMRSSGSLAVYTSSAWDLNVQSAGSAEQFSGSDSVGEFNATSWKWKTKGVRLVTSIRQYQEAVVFSLQYPDGAKGTAAKTSANFTGHSACPSANFPSFSGLSNKAQKPGSLGYISWGGNMCNHSNVPLLASVNEPGVDTGGPIVLYDHHNGSTVVVSSLNQFMTAQSTINQQLPFGDGNEAVFGPGGELVELPPGFTQEHIVFCGRHGITQTMLGWGARLRNATGNVQRIHDQTLTKLGAWTDHGAYFYFFQSAPPFPHAANVVLQELADYYRSVQLPVSYYQLDAWWYAQGGYNACLQRFTPNGRWFNTSLQALQTSMNISGWSLYHSYFCHDSPYWKANGGNYTPVGTNNNASNMTGSLYNLPSAESSEALYTEVFTEGLAQGMIGTELDYEHVDYDSKQ